MKILFICHRYPFPPNRGGKIRPFNVIRHLSRNHEVTVASMARSKAEAEAGLPLADYCSRTIMAVVDKRVQMARTVLYGLSAAPASMGYFYSRGLKQRIQTALDTVAYDLIFVHCSSVAPYVASVKGAPKLLDFGDMDSQKWLDIAQYRGVPMKWVFEAEGRKLMIREKRLARSFDFCTVTTRAELDTLSGYDCGVPVDYFPNGVDFDYFTPGDEEYDPNMISFVGRMDYYPNQQAMVEFCSKTLPTLRQRLPEVRLSIIGAAPSAAILALGNLPGVTVTGTVPDVRPMVRRSALTIAPLQIARGTQNKMLEAMAMGVPVVSSRTALRGVDATDGEHLLAADTPQEYVDAIESVLRSPQRRAQLSRACRERMRERHSWANSMQRLDGLLERCVRQTGAGREPCKVTA
jgi:sugar transferase (PEP-CTERM/EpsH1 system associated)